MDVATIRAQWLDIIIDVDALPVLLFITRNTLDCQLLSISSELLACIVKQLLLLPINYVSGLLRFASLRKPIGGNRPYSDNNRTVERTCKP